MGYYDFDDHFWQPCEVCAQKAQETDEKAGKFSLAAVWCWLRCHVFAKGDRVTKNAEFEG
ncbi:MAG: hypothetical protein SAJ12_06310 [Jaaginema sp. PMC 1079.18]|nr:hypothetical protein [Jaaginema sp. PMC 1080.18]MEC4850606.1 hypothetical protein [Jaaginema sp. PMC 1079.18]MEC4867718.1 hypothetical protein [Jaaginema sp. PMC 1078.18]